MAESLRKATTYYPLEQPKTPISATISRQPNPYQRVWHFQELVQAKALEIIDKWIDFFINPAS